MKLIINPILVSVEGAADPVPVLYAGTLDEAMAEWERSRTMGEPFRCVTGRFRSESVAAISLDLETAAELAGCVVADDEGNEAPDVTAYLKRHLIEPLAAARVPQKAGKVHRGFFAEPDDDGEAEGAE